MGIKLVVKGKQVSGNNNGGEDLFLDFEATEDANVATLEVELGNGDPDWDLNYPEDDNASLDETTEEGEQPEDEDEIPWRVKTSNYDFEWAGTVNDLKKLFEKLGGHDKANWTWSGPVTKDPAQRWTKTHYVGGNAD